MSYAQAREWVRASGIDTIAGWREAAASGRLPPGVPRAPQITYQGHGWSGFPAFFGRERLRRGGKPRGDATETLRPRQRQPRPRVRSSGGGGAAARAAARKYVDVFLQAPVGGEWRNVRAWETMPERWAPGFCRVMVRREKTPCRWLVLDEAGAPRFRLERDGAGSLTEWKVGESG